MPTTCATYDDVNLILRLFELRREERMRQARQWFTASFHAKTCGEVNELCPPESDDNASFRMVVSYWDMVASFITGGVLQRGIFFESGFELLLVWVRIKDFLPEMRESRKDPTTWKNLETVGKAYAEWLNKRSPGSYEAFVERVG